MTFRCLLVDDNQRFLDVARRGLERQGLHAVDTALDIDSALQAVATRRPDVVLVDVSLGLESGFDLVRRLAERFSHLAGRIIMISTRDEEDYAELMEGASAAGFLGKSSLSVQGIRTLIPDLP
jgi:DNA-binding response OmpR family regulator